MSEEKKINKKEITQTMKNIQEGSYFKYLGENLKWDLPETRIQDL